MDKDQIHTIFQREQGKVPPYTPLQEVQTLAEQMPWPVQDANGPGGKEGLEEALEAVLFEQ